MSFNTTDFVNGMGNKTGLDLLQWIGANVYSISLVLVMLIPLIVFLLITLPNMKGGRIQLSTLIMALVIAEVIRIILIILVIVGILPSMLSVL